MKNIIGSMLLLILVGCSEVKIRTDTPNEEFIVIEGTSTGISKIPIKTMYKYSKYTGSTYELWRDESGFPTWLKISN